MLTKYNISVIIPIYNNEKYIVRCVESILKQNFNSFEIILIDDESTDKSGQICDEYAEKYSFIRVIHTNNGGPARARRIGVDHANGKYIMFIDSDDYIAVDMMQELYNFSEDADIVCSNYYKVIDGNIEKQPFYKEDLIYHSTFEILYEFFSKRYLNGAVWGKIIKRKLLNDIDFCESTIIGEDINVMLQLYEKAEVVKCISKPLYYYVQNLEGISHSGYTEKHRAGLEYYIMTRQRVIKVYPELKIEATAFFLEYEMATITAMCRNRLYDTLVIKKLQNDLKDNLCLLLRNKYTASYMKISAIIIVFNYNLFCFIFSRIRKRVGR